MVGSTAVATNCSTSPSARPTMPTASRQGNATKRDAHAAAVAVAAAAVEAADRANASRAKRAIRPRCRPIALQTTATSPVVRLIPTTAVTKSHSPPATACGPPPHGRPSPAAARAKGANPAAGADAAGAVAVPQAKDRGLQRVNRAANRRAGVAGVASDAVPATSARARVRASLGGDGMISSPSHGATTKTTKASSSSALKRPAVRPARVANRAVVTKTMCSPRAASVRCSTCRAGSRRSASSSLRTSTPAAARSRIGPTKTAVAAGK